MAKKGNVVSPRPARQSGHVSTPEPTQWLTFSFKYLDCDDDVFGLAKCEQDWLHDLVSRLRDLCGWRPAEFHANHSKALRAHPIDFASTTRPDGFGIKKVPEHRPLAIVRGRP